MSEFKVITFDVEHGNCHALITPNNHLILIDAGNRGDFSPARHLNEVWGHTSLRWLTVTHFDSDHLSDIDNVAKFVRPRTLEQPAVTSGQLLHLYPDGFSQTQETFFEFRASYNTPAPEMSDPGYDWGGVQFATFQNDFTDFDSPKINNLSVVTFAKYAGWGFMFPGDLERVGWLKLLENEDFIEQLKHVSVLIAAHHGREAGFCKEIFDYCSPNLVIISDKGWSETSRTELYSDQSYGLYVRSRSRGRVHRKVLTTRQDGAVMVEITNEGKYWVTCD